VTLYLTEIKIKNKSDFDYYKDYIPEGLKTEGFIDLRCFNITAWSEGRFKLENPEFYSKELLDEFDRVFKATTSYLKGNSIKIIARRYNLTISIIKRLARDILAGKSMENILRSRIGLQGKLGLDLAVATIKKFQFKMKKLPRSTDKGMDNVIRGVCKGDWKRFGIHSWNDLLIQTFTEEQIKSWEELERKRKFNEAVIKIRKFFQKFQRLPKLIDEEVKDIHNTIVNGYWINYGIKKWNDFLLYVFGEVNFNSTKYVSLDGFNKAKYELQKYYEETGKLPLYDDFEGITNAIKKGYWIKYGINTWNKLLLYVFGDVNLIINKYKGKKGLEFIKHKFKEFEHKNNRILRTNDKGMSGIYRAVNRGEWTDFGIKDWSELINIIFHDGNSSLS